MSLPLLAAAVGVAFVTLVLVDARLVVAVMGRKSSPGARADWYLGALSLAVAGLLAAPALSRHVAAAFAVLLAVHLVRYGIWRRHVLRGLVYPDRWAGDDGRGKSTGERTGESASRLSALLEAVTRKAGLRRRPAVGIDPSDRLGPALVGTWRPLLVVPAGALSRDPSSLSAMLAHEIAHQRRRDGLRSWALAVLGDLLAWHPLARCMARAVRLETEMECDRLAASWIGRATYARALLDWAVDRQESAARFRPAAAASHLDTPSLSARLQALALAGVDSQPDGPKLKGWAVLPYAGAWLALLSVVLRLI